MKICSEFCSSTKSHSQTSRRLFRTPKMGSKQPRWLLSNKIGCIVLRTFPSSYKFQKLNFLRDKKKLIQSTATFKLYQTAININILVKLPLLYASKHNLRENLLIGRIHTILIKASTEFVQ